MFTLAKRLLLVAVAAGLFCTGCDQLTRDHFDMITVGVDAKPDVERMIGEPTNKLDDQWHYQRMDKHLEVFVDFDDSNVVTRKQWIDALNEEWYDTKKSDGQPSYESTEIRKIN